MPKAKSKTPMTETGSVPEDIIEIEHEPQEDTIGHGVVNPIEVCHHVQLLDESIQALELKIKMGEIKNILKDALEDIHKVVTKTVPYMKDANTADVLKSIKDPTRLILHQRSEKVEQL